MTATHKTKYAISDTVHVAYYDGNTDNKRIFDGLIVGILIRINAEVDYEVEIKRDGQYHITVFTESKVFTSREDCAHAEMQLMLAL